jgi:hypothetical protein
MMTHFIHIWDVTHKMHNNGLVAATPYVKHYHRLQEVSVLPCRRNMLDCESSAALPRRSDLLKGQ